MNPTSSCYMFVTCQLRFLSKVSRKSCFLNACERTRTIMRAMLSQNSILIFLMDLNRLAGNISYIIIVLQIHSYKVEILAIQPAFSSHSRFPKRAVFKCNLTTILHKIHAYLSSILLSVYPNV